MSWKWLTAEWYSNESMQQLKDNKLKVTEEDVRNYLHLNCRWRDKIKQKERWLLRETDSDALRVKDYILFEFVLLICCWSFVLSSLKEPSQVSKVTGNISGSPILSIQQERCQTEMICIVSKCPKTLYKKLIKNISSSILNNSYK